MRTIGYQFNFPRSNYRRKWRNVARLLINGLIDNIISFIIIIITSIIGCTAHLPALYSFVCFDNFKAAGTRILLKIIAYRNTVIKIHFKRQEKRLLLQFNIAVGTYNFTDRAISEWKRNKFAKTRFISVCILTTRRDISQIDSQQLH